MRHANEMVWSVNFSGDGKHFSREARTTPPACGMPKREFSSDRRYKMTVRSKALSSARTECESLRATEIFMDTPGTVPSSGTAHEPAPCGAVMNHDGYVSSMAFSPDGAGVLTASKSSQGYAARLWDANTAPPSEKR